MKILLIDDDAVLLAFLERGLSREGYTVSTCSNGIEALGRIRQEKPDLIILDVLLPGLDGTEIGGYLQEDYATSGIPILYLTGLEEKETNVLDTPFLAENVMAKPVDMKALIEKVKQLTQGKVRRNRESG